MCIRDSINAETVAKELGIDVSLNYSTSDSNYSNLISAKVISENEKGKKINVYVDPFSGEVSAIRSLQWRIWDFMWGIHIMDWVERDNIDNLWLKVFSFIALFTSLSGIILFFNRRT